MSSNTKNTASSSAAKKAPAKAGASKKPAAEKPADKVEKKVEKKEEEKPVKAAASKGKGKASSKEAEAAPERQEAPAAAAEEAEKAQVDIITVDSQIDELIKELAENMVRDKNLTRRLQSLKKTYAKEVRDLRKTKKGGRAQKANAGPKKPSGFAQSSKIGDELCDFLEVEQGSRMARTDVTKRVIAYIKANKLENEKNHRNIEPDEALEKLVGGADERRATMEERKKRKPDTQVTDVLSYFNLQVHLNRHFIKETAEEKRKYNEQKAQEESAQQASASA